MIGLQCDNRTFFHRLVLLKKGGIAIFSGEHRIAFETIQAFADTRQMYARACF